MAISYIGSASGTNTATMPTHAVGDLIVAFAYRDGNVTPPTLPAGWSAVNGSGGNSNSERAGWKIAASTSETVGTWTNATSVIVAVYRGADSIGGTGVTTGSSATVTFPAVTMQVSDGTSWIVGCVGHRSTNVAINTAPTGMTNRIQVADATDEAALHDTNGGVSSFTSRTAALGGTASGFASISFELRASVAPTLTGQTVDATSSTSGTPKVTTNKASGTLYMVAVPNGDTPSVAQIKLGQDSSSGTAINAQNQTVTSSGLKSFSAVTGLTTATPYDFWFVHTNSEGDSSAVKADYTPVADYGNVWVLPFNISQVGVGDGWSFIESMYTDDNDEGYVILSADGNSAALLAFDFNLEIASDADITGFSVELDAWAPDPASIQQIFLSSDSGANPVSGSTTKTIVVPTTQSTKTTFGGSSDTWGLTLTPTMVNDAAFRVVIKIASGLSFDEFDIDVVRIKVHTPIVTTQNKLTLFWASP